MGTEESAAAVKIDEASP
jgi:hypothetical protein